jgi:hypothetical protein
LPGRLFSFWCGDFFWRGGVAILQGYLQKNGVFVWCFDGENVVDCVVNVVR